MQAGDFSGLGKNYSSYRPAYAEPIVDAVLGLTQRGPSVLDIVDVGAGTGIWTRMLANKGCRTVTAVEPNDDMRAHGIADSAGTSINWVAGTGENTGLPSECADIVSMASSFHWVDFEGGTAEFRRLLRPGGWFVALWNPRVIAGHPDLEAIEAQLTVIEPNLVRRSSGHSGRTEGLHDRLLQHPEFSDVVYLEGRHSVNIPLEHYIGAWRSVNDVQVQLGPERFERFIAYIRDRLAGQTHVRAEYATKAWAARRK